MALRTNALHIRNARIRLALAALALLPATLAAGQQDSAQDPTQDWGTLDLDSLISRLPTIGSERSWDEDNRKWVKHPAVLQFQDRIGGGVQLSDTQWSAALLKSGAIRMRNKWPKDVPLAISMRDPAWLPLCEIEMTPTTPSSLSPAKAGSTVGEFCGTCALGREERAAHQVLGALPPGKHEVTFAVQIERGTPLFGPEEDVPPQGVVWAGHMAFTVEIVSSIDEVLPPLSEETLDDAVAESLWMQLVGDARGHTTELLCLWGEQPSTFERLRGVVVGIDAELWNEGKLMETQHFVAKVDYSGDPSDPKKGWLRGTEGFETLPLVQTGRSQPTPIVMLDGPGGTYWKDWHQFFRNQLLAGGYVSPEDEALFFIADGVDEARQEILNFYSCYHSSRYVDHGQKLVLRLKHSLSEALIKSLNEEFQDIVREGSIEACDPYREERDEPDLLELSRLSLSFNRRNFGCLRQLIDRINKF